MLGNVSVVLLSYNRKDELKKNVPPLCKLADNEDLEFIIVDNNSTDGSQEYLQKVNKTNQDVTVIFNNENKGVAEGRNTGLQEVTGEFIICIDDDLALNFEDIKTLVDTAKSNPTAGVISPKIIHPETERVQNDYGEELCEIGNYHGACHLIRKEAYDKIGRIDPKCTFGGEELDFSINARAAGYDVLYQPNVEVYHNNYKRKEEESVRRYTMRVYNYTRIHFKYFTNSTALIFSFRYLVSHLYNTASMIGVSGVIKMVRLFILGIREGIAEQTTIPKDVREYYAREDRRPDTGNVPLWKKI